MSKPEKKKNTKSAGKGWREKAKTDAYRNGYDLIDWSKKGKKNGKPKESS